MASDEGYGFLYPKKDRKEGQPQLTGTATLVGGREIEIAAWPRKSKNGVKYLSLKVQDADGRGGDETPDEQGTQTAIGDDDIPF